MFKLEFGSANFTPERNWRLFWQICWGSRTKQRILRILKFWIWILKYGMKISGVFAIPAGGQKSESMFSRFHSYQQPKIHPNFVLDFKELKPRVSSKTHKISSEVSVERKPETFPKFCICTLKTPLSPNFQIQE
jgi:hypothetical protein